MNKRISVPAVSHEMEFVARNWAVIEDLAENVKKGAVVDLTEMVWEKARVDVDRLLRALERAVTDAGDGTLRVLWANTNRGESWQPWARVYLSRGPKRKIADLGFTLCENKMALRLIGWIWPRWGGLDGRHRLARYCNNKVGDVFFPSERARRFPGWSDNDGVIWLDEQLTIRTTLDQITESVQRRARRFLKAARWPLIELSN
jgi:hypothetical protein